MSSNLFLNSFGVVPKAPIMIGITFTRVFQIVNLLLLLLSLLLLLLVLL